MLYPHEFLYGNVDATAFAARARQRLPTNGSIYEQLQFVIDDNLPTASSVGPTGTGAQPANDTHGDWVEANMGQTFVHSLLDRAGSAEITRRAAQRITSPSDEPIAAPTINPTGIPESRPYLIIGSFPCRFLNMYADYYQDVCTQQGVSHGAQHLAAPIHRHRPVDISLEAYFESLVWYWDPIQLRYPFASHQVANYYFLDRVHRMRALTKATIFVRNLPARLTATQFQAQVRAGNDYTLNNIFARTSGLKGSAAYWMAQRPKWYSYLMYWQYFSGQLASVWFTMSEPEISDPFLHKALDQVLPSAKRYYNMRPKPNDDLLRRKRAVVENLHIVTWFFDRKVGFALMKAAPPLWSNT